VPYPAYNPYPQPYVYGENQNTNQMRQSYPNDMTPVTQNTSIYPNLNNIQQPPNYNYYQNQPAPIKQF
jgi:hypothetical protein